MKFEEISISFEAAPKGRIERTVNLGNVVPIRETFSPALHISAQGTYRDWFGSFYAAPTAASRAAIEARRRTDGEQLFKDLLGRAAASFRRRLDSVEQSLADDELRTLRLRLILGDVRGRGRSDASLVLPATSLPWELAADPERSRFLARERSVSIVRTLGVIQPPAPVRVRGGLRVLVVNAEPEGATPLGWQVEVDRITSALKARSDTVVDFLGSASFDETRHRLKGVHVFHFIGHGGFDSDAGQWYLLFEKNRQREPVLAEDLADALGGSATLRLAVLNACHSGELAKVEGADPLSGIAAAVSAHRVPAVIGMQIAVTDSGAVEFATEFYRTLAEGLSIETALADARSRIRVFSPEWATPVFYLGGPSSDLFEFGTARDLPAERGEEARPRVLELGIRTLVVSEKLPHVAAWARKLRETSERLLPLEEYFEGRFILSPDSSKEGDPATRSLWETGVLPRLERFLDDAVSQERPIGLQMAAHTTVAFAAGYYFHTKPSTQLTIVQVTASEPLRWNEKEGVVPLGPLWQDFESKDLASGGEDIAVAIEISNNTADAVERYLQESGIPIGRLIRARIAGEPGLTRIGNGAHAYQMAWSLQQWLKDNTGNRAKRRLHLFVSAPNGFAFYLGKLARPLGPIRLYEYDLEGTKHGTYEPSLDLPVSPQG